MKLIKYLQTAEQTIIFRQLLKKPANFRLSSKSKLHEHIPRHATYPTNSDSSISCSSQALPTPSKAFLRQLKLGSSSYASPSITRQLVQKPSWTTDYALLRKVCSNFCPGLNKNETRKLSLACHAVQRKNFSTLTKNKKSKPITYKTGQKYRRFGSINDILFKLRLFCRKPVEKTAPNPAPMKMNIVTDKCTPGKTKLEIFPVIEEEQKRVTPMEEDIHSSEKKRKLICIRKNLVQPDKSYEESFKTKPEKYLKEPEVICPEPPDTRDHMSVPYYFKKVCVKTENGRCVKYEMQRCPMPDIIKKATCKEKKSPCGDICVKKLGDTRESVAALIDICSGRSTALPICNPCETTVCYPRTTPSIEPEPCQKEVSAPKQKNELYEWVTQKPAPIRDPCRPPPKAIPIYDLYYKKKVKPCKKEDSVSKSHKSSDKTSPVCNPCKKDVCEPLTAKPSICDPCRPRPKTAAVYDPCKTKDPCNATPAVSKSRPKTAPICDPCTSQPKIVPICDECKAKAATVPDPCKKDDLCKGDVVDDPCKKRKPHGVTAVVCAPRSKTGPICDPCKKNDPCGVTPPVVDPCKSRPKIEPVCDLCKKKDSCKPFPSICDPCKSQSKTATVCDPCKEKDPCKPSPAICDPCKAQPKTTAVCDPCKKKDPCEPSPPVCDPCRAQPKTVAVCGPCKEKDPCKPSPAICEPCKAQPKTTAVCDPCKKKDPCKPSPSICDPCKAQPKNAVVCDPCKKQGPCKPRPQTAPVCDPCKKKDPCEASSPKPCIRTPRRPRSASVRKKKDACVSTASIREPCRKISPSPSNDPCKKPCKPGIPVINASKQKGSCNVMEKKNPCEVSTSISAISDPRISDPCKSKPKRVRDPCKRKDPCKAVEKVRKCLICYPHGETPPKHSTSTCKKLEPITTTGLAKENEPTVPKNLCIKKRKRCEVMDGERPCPVCYKKNESSSSMYECRPRARSNTSTKSQQSKKQKQCESKESIKKKKCEIKDGKRPCPICHKKGAVSCSSVRKSSAIVEPPRGSSLGRTRSKASLPVNCPSCQIIIPLRTVHTKSEKTFCKPKLSLVERRSNKCKHCGSDTDHASHSGGGKTGNSGSANFDSLQLCKKRKEVASTNKVTSANFNATELIKKVRAEAEQKKTAKEQSRNRKRRKPQTTCEESQLCNPTCNSDI